MKIKYALLLWLNIISTTILAQTNTEHKKWFDWGIKAGVNAPYIDIQKFEVNGVEKDEPEIQSKVGYFFAVFSRINIRKHYIQLDSFGNSNRPYIFRKQPD